MFVSRTMYNMLVRSFPVFMETTWLRLTRQWSLGGIQVEGKPVHLEQLQQRMIEIVEPDA